MADDRDLERLEAIVQRACSAVYMAREGYWPSDSERARIAIAVCSMIPPPCTCAGRAQDADPSVHELGCDVTWWEIQGGAFNPDGTRRGAGR